MIDNIQDHLELHTVLVHCTMFWSFEYWRRELLQELDYATNFLANGPGQWKDSGLGEAFRAAVDNPDII